MFIGRTDVEGETPVLWPPHVKSWLTGKDPDAGKDWGQKEKGMTEDEMVGWGRDRLDKQGFRKRDTVKEWETRQKNSEKSEDRGPTPLQGEGAETESKPAYYTLSCEWKNMWGVKL